MYAVIETGGKQYRVEVGTELEVELLDGEPGQSITLERVLLVADGDEASIGRPLVPSAAVHAEVVRRDRGEKLISFKYRPKARSRVKKGHRQELTVLRVTDVVLNGRSAAEAKRKLEQDARTERERLEEAAARQAAEDAKLAAKLAARKAPEATASEAGTTAGETTSTPTRRGGRAKAAADATAGTTAAPTTTADTTPAADTTSADTTAAADTASAGDTAPGPVAAEAVADPKAADTTPTAADDAGEPTEASGPGAAEARDTPADAPRRSRTRKSE